MSNKKLKNRKAIQEFKSKAEQVCDSVGGLDYMLERFNIFKLAVNRTPVKKNTLVRYMHGYKDGRCVQDFKSFIDLCR